MALDITGIGSVAEFFGKLVDKIFPDANQAAAAKAAYLQAEQSGALQTVLAQLEINKVEAASTSWFVAGWRPFVGWVCGFGLCYQFLFFPMFSKVLQITPLDASALTALLTGMLGFGALRTVEKYNEVAR